MTRLLPEHFKRDGRPKRSFQSRDDALIALNEIARDASQHPYKCRLCGRWHLGHAK